MAALAAAIQRDGLIIWGSSIVQSWRVCNSKTIYAGAWTALAGANAQTSCRGYLNAWTNDINLKWGGMAIPASATNNLSTVNSVVGDSSGTPIPEISTECQAFVLRTVAVTGVSAQTDVGRTQVYASNDNDLTTTANQSPYVGWVVRWYSSTTCDVLFQGVINAWFG